MRGHVVALVVLASVTLAAGAAPALTSASAWRATPPLVLVRSLSTLDASGHVRHVFRPGTQIKLRVQWTVRGAPPQSRQSVTWAVVYAGKETLRVTKTSPARNGNWSRITVATITRLPNIGTHTFSARISVAGVSATGSVPFIVQG